MLTDEQFDELADKLLKKIAPQLGVELEEEQPKSATVVRDKDGKEYDLKQCAIGPCVISVEGVYYLYVELGIPGNTDYEEYWMSTWGDKFSTRELASILTDTWWRLRCHPGLIHWPRNNNNDNQGVTMSIVDLAVKLGKAFEGTYSSVVKNDEMKTTITQEARTGVYTITTKDTDLIALLDQGIVEKAPVTMIKPMTYGVVSPGVYTVPGHKMQEILENRPKDYL